MVVSEEFTVAQLVAVVVQIVWFIVPGYSPELHNAGLRIEGKIRDVDVAGALVYCRRLPYNAPVAVQNSLVHYCDHVITVGTKGFDGFNGKF